MQYAILAVVGLFTGILGGMLGIGGSIIMLPAMVWILGTYNSAGTTRQIHQYMAAAMIVNFLLSIPSVAAHWKNGAIWPKLAKFLMLGGLVGVVAGVLLSTLFSGNAAKYLQWFLGAFFVYVAYDNFSRVFRQSHAEVADRTTIEAGPWLRKTAIGAVVGVFSGLTGLGGGVLAVPAQQYILKVPVRNAIANSSALIVSIAWLGAITKNITLGSEGTVARSMLLAACLAPTAMVGAYFGGHLTHRLPIKTIRLAFALLVLVSAYKMFI